MSVVIRGTGSYLPERVLTNADLEALVETSDEWIVARTGMRERHILAAEQATSDLATRAAERALESAGLTANDIDLIVCSTFTPDMPTPAAACFVQRTLCKGRAIPAFDLSAACAGFLYGIEVVRAMLEGGSYRRALLIGCESLSRYTDYTDRGTCVLFGDAAGAIVLERADTDRGGILASTLKSDGEFWELICVPGGGSRLPPSSSEVISERAAFVKMQGPQVFKLAVQSMEQVAHDTLERVGWSLADVDHLLVHQANRRIIDAVADRMNVPPEKLPTCIEMTGNVSSATIPFLMDQCNREGRLRPGDRILLVAFGAGLVWGAVALEWAETGPAPA